MSGKFFSFLWENKGTILTAFALALAVWISAVIQEDPNREGEFPIAIPVQIIGLSDDQIIVDEIPTQVVVELRTPSSIWNELVTDPEKIQASINITDLDAGDYTLPFDIDINAAPIQVLSTIPATANFTIENSSTEEFILNTNIIGQPALGFQTDRLRVGVNRIQVSGPDSLVELIEKVQADINIEGSREDVIRTAPIYALDKDGQRVSGVTISPNQVEITQAVIQSGGYRDVAVKVETEGQVATGYRVTNISVSPPTVTVFSTNPELVAEMPGFVSTLPLDLTDAQDDIEIRLALALPENITLVSDDQSVQVQIGIAAIETSITLSIEIETRGLAPGLKAEVSPQTVDVFISGPIQVIEALSPEDIRIFVNLTDLEVGTHLITAEAEILPSLVHVDAIAPETIEVIISIDDGIVITPTIQPQ